MFVCNLFVLRGFVVVREDQVFMISCLISVLFVLQVVYPEAGKE